MTADIKTLVNELLDEIREREGITSDEALGRRLDVSGQAIYRWRKGQIDKIAKALLPYVVERNHCKDPKIAA